MSTMISPGVFTNEVDVSGVAQGVSDIGAVIVAPFSKGVGFYPTIVTSVADLQSKFGIPDGTLYGPYTAAQYLQAKGFVTVCRVGALTGYQQKYPLFIWAESGAWTRGGDVGYLVSQSSNIPIIVNSINTIPAGMTFDTSSATVVGLSSTSGSYTGEINFNGVAASLTLQGTAGTATIGTASAYGSVLYAGQTVNGTINGSVRFTGALSIPTSSYFALTGSAQSALILNEILFKSYVNLSQSFDLTGTAKYNPVAFFTSDINAGATPTIVIQSGSIIKALDHCGSPELLINGWLSGSFNNLDGGFTPLPNGSSYNTCSYQWTGTPSKKVLAVLADTQWATIGSNLQSPGFYGSSGNYITEISGSSLLPNSGSANVIDSFVLTLSSSLGNGIGTYNFSIDESNPQYITNVFGSDATAGNQNTYVQGTKIEAAYLYSIYEDTIAAVNTTPDNWKIHFDVMPSGSGFVGEPLNFTDADSFNPTNGDSQYSLTHATTPWVLSQQVAAWNGGTPHRFNLFRIHTLDDGTYNNTTYKIQISNVKLAGTVAGSDWGTFTLTVRDFNDSDRRPVVLEQYNNLSLDPTSANFIARIIGDQYAYINFNGKIVEFGNYANISKYIRVEVSDINYPVSAVPYGFAAYSLPTSGELSYFTPNMAFTRASVYGLFPGKYPSGVDFSGPPTGADNELIGLYPTASVYTDCFNDNLQYFSPLPAGSTAGNNYSFALDYNEISHGVSTGSFISGSNSIPATITTNETTYVKMRNFIFGFQGGFNGQSPAIPLNVGVDIVSGNTQGLNCTNSTSAGSVAYAQCIGALSNADEWDINLITTPGIIYSLHSYVTNLVIDMCENRSDVFYIADLYEDEGNPTTSQVQEVVDLASELDTNYAGTYYPWIKILDSNTNQIVTVPPSVVMPAVYANNDKVAGAWFVPAGLNRGGITGAVQVTDRTTHAERDTLYSGRVNPIAAFPGEGIVAWGQKTLQVKDSALNRIGVRRLLIEIKKYISSISKYLLFEQNTAQTRNKFLSIVNPYLEGVQQQSGLYAFQVQMDDKNNTPDIIDQEILYGQLWIQPTRTAEFIKLDFMVLPTGAVFPNS